MQTSSARRDRHDTAPSTAPESIDASADVSPLSLPQPSEVLRSLTESKKLLEEARQELKEAQERSQSASTRPRPPPSAGSHALSLSLTLPPSRYSPPVAHLLSTTWLLRTPPRDPGHRACARDGADVHGPLRSLQRGQDGPPAPGPLERQVPRPQLRSADRWLCRVRPVSSLPRPSCAPLVFRAGPTPEVLHAALA